MELRNSRYKKIIVVQPEHLDAVNHVNNVVYVEWMQEIAREHWNKYASAALQDEVMWMIKRHEIDYYHQAFLNDELEMETWTGDYTNVTWKRHYSIKRLSDGKKIIESVSVWIPLNSKTLRPRRVDDELINMFA